MTAPSPAAVPRSAAAAGGAVLVGATGGIGASIARRLAGDGPRPLVLMDLAGDALDGLAQELDATAVPVDLSDAETVEAAFRAAAAALPDGVAALVLAAGVVDTAKLGELTPERWDRILAVGPDRLLSVLPPRPADDGRWRADRHARLGSPGGPAAS